MKIILKHLQAQRSVLLFTTCCCELLNATVSQTDTHTQTQSSTHRHRHIHTQTHTHTSMHVHHAHIKNQLQYWYISSYFTTHFWMSGSLKTGQIGQCLYAGMCYGCWSDNYFEDYNNQLHCLKLPQFLYRNCSCESKYGWPLCFTGGHLKVIWSCHPLIYHSVRHNAVSTSCSHIRLLLPPSFHTMQVVPVSPSFSKSYFVCQAHFDKIPFSLYLSIQLLLSIPVIFLYYILWALFVHFLHFMYCFSSTILAPDICPSVIVLV